MSNFTINADTTRLRSNGEEILKLANELGNILDTMFNRIEQMPTTTLEWTGNAAKTFALHARKDKQQYYKLKNDLSKIGSVLCETANNIESTTKGLNYL